MPLTAASISRILDQCRRELVLDLIHSSGPGGQNVNKVATAVQLRFDIRRARALDLQTKARLIRQGGKRVTAGGVLVLRADRYRTQARQSKRSAWTDFRRSWSDASSRPSLAVRRAPARLPGATTSIQETAGRAQATAAAESGLRLAATRIVARQDPTIPGECQPARRDARLHVDSGAISFDWPRLDQRLRAAFQIYVRAKLVGGIRSSRPWRRLGPRNPPLNDH